MHKTSRSAGLARGFLTALGIIILLLALVCIARTLTQRRKANIAAKKEAVISKWLLAGTHYDIILGKDGNITTYKFTTTLPKNRKEKLVSVEVKPAEFQEIESAALKGTSSRPKHIPGVLILWKKLLVHFIR